MALSASLISQLVKTTNDSSSSSNTTSTTVYGTARKVGGTWYVLVDGSEQLVPVSSTATLSDGDRVMMVIENHSATVTGNLTDQSASSSSYTSLQGYVDDMNNTIIEQDNYLTLLANTIYIEDSEIEATNALISIEDGTVKIQGVSIDSLNDTINTQGNTITAIENTLSLYNSYISITDDNITISGVDITALNSAMEVLESTISIYNSSFQITDGVVTGLVGIDGITYITVEDLTADHETVQTLEVGLEKVDSLEAELASINSLLAGNVGSGTVQTVYLTADNAVIDEAVIVQALIENETVGTLLAGVIYTNLITIQSGEGDNGLYIADSLIAMYDENDIQRLQAGRAYSDEEFNFVIWNADKEQIFNATGITATGIPSETIVDAHVATNANISGEKLNIKSVIQYIETDGSLTVDYANVVVDETTLDYALTTINSNAEAAAAEAAVANAAAAEAQATADKAQADATQAATDAVAAQSTADAAATAATNAQTAADTAAQAAADAQSAADTAKANAATAQSTANSAASVAQAAQTAANTAQSAADDAQAAADDAAAAAQTAQDEYDALASRADATEEELAAAQEKLTAAQSAASAAQSTADTAKANAATAQAAADQAASDAAAAQSTAVSAAADAATAQSAADAAASDAAAAQSTANTAKANAATAQTTANNAATAAATAQTAANAAQTAADEAQAAADAVATRTTTLETEVSVVQGIIDLLVSETDITELQNGTTTLYQKYSEINETVDEITSTVSTLETEVSDNYESLTSQISEIKQTADGITASVSSVQTQLDNLSVGGRNLARYNNIVNSSVSSFDKSEFITSGTITGIYDSQYSGFHFDAASIYEPNTEYVLSYWIQLNDGEFTCLGGHNGKSMLNMTALYVDGVKYTYSSSYTCSACASVLNDGEKHYVVLYFTTPDEIVADSGSYYTYIQPNRASTTSVTCTISGLKLEKGTIATDWTPAPEDMEDALSEMSETNSETYATKTEVTNEITESVGTTDGISEAEDEVQDLLLDENGDALTVYEALLKVASYLTLTSSSFSIEFESISSDLTALTDGTIADLQSDSEAYSKKLSYVSVTDDPAIVLGASDSDFKVRITTTEIDFLEGDSKVAWISNQQLYITEAEASIVNVESKLSFWGTFSWININGALVLIKEGYEEVEYEDEGSEDE